MQGCDMSSGHSSFLSPSHPLSSGMMPFSLACSGPGGSNAEHPATEMVVNQSRGQQEDDILFL